jgi:hypothetical protein
MTALLRLVCGRSLFSDLPRWEKLQNSYEKRNKIIHDGSSATEDDAEEALSVARWVVDFTENIS